MNVLFLLTPKKDVDFLFGDFTVRQAIEKMKEHRYTMIPVIDRKSGKYLYSMREGDFLYYLMENRLSFEDLEHIPLSNILPSRSIVPVTIECESTTLYSTIAGQNYVPVVDDQGTFIGIGTRKAVMKDLLGSAK